MAITLVKQQGNMILVYDGPRQLFAKHGVLQGYTGSSVTVKDNNMLFTFDEKGRQISARSA